MSLEDYEIDGENAMDRLRDYFETQRETLALIERVCNTVARSYPLDRVTLITALLGLTSLDAVAGYLRAWNSHVLAASERDPRPHNQAFLREAWRTFRVEDYIEGLSRSDLQQMDRLRDYLWNAIETAIELAFDDNAEIRH